MKKFSDLLAIDPKIDLCIHLEPVAHNGYPEFWISVNDKIIEQGTLTHSLTKHCEIDLLDTIKLEIGMKQKSYSAEKETAVIIRSINIDGFEIVPNWTHLAIYQNDHNNGSPTSYLGFNGAWRLDIPEPFYRWRHRVTGQGWLLEPVKS
jgi:hypothetical protein